MAVRLERFVKPPAEIATLLLSTDGGACLAFHLLPTVFHRFVPMFFPGIHAGSADRVDIDCPTDFVMPKDSGPEKKRQWIAPAESGVRRKPFQYFAKLISQLQSA